MDAAQHKEAVLKARLGHWLEEGYVLTSSIEGKLASLQVTQQKIQEDSTEIVTEKLVEQVKKVAMQCIVEVVVVHVELGGLPKIISTPAE